MIDKNSVNKKFFIPLCISIFILGIILSITCTNTNNISPEDRPRSTSWIEVLTGYNDSNWTPPGTITDEEFAKNLNKAGFKVRWNRVDDADYYQILISKNAITNRNCKKATLATAVPNTSDSIITATIDMIQPSISGRKCTGCQACVPECPRHAITIFKGKSVIDLDSCIGCSRCYEVCTYDAVSNQNLTKFYYFAVRAFNDNDIPAEDVTCTNDLFKSRYFNVLYQNPIIGLKLCGFCGAGCYILNPDLTDSIQLGACPVDAIYWDPNPNSTWGHINAVYIDQSKCISCGLCVEQCAYNEGNWSVRREIVSASEGGLWE